ncbi:hypothetical protein Emed_001692 [Eimeria media]
MICARKAKTASAAEHAVLSPGLKTNQPGVKSIVGAADCPHAAAHSKRPQRFCLILFILPLLGLLCSAATEAPSRNLGDAADTLMPEGKVFNAQSHEESGKAVSPPVEGMTQATDDLQVDSSLPATPSEVDAEMTCQSGACSTKFKIGQEAYSSAYYRAVPGASPTHLF